MLGHLSLEGAGLDNVVQTGECFVCNTLMSCTIRDVLEQPLNGAADYCDDGGLGAAKCPSARCGQGHYVTYLCLGKAQFDSGKFYNHCTDCPEFGTCVGDLRNEVKTQTGQMDGKKGQYDLFL